MKEIWTLIIKTSLPKQCHSPADIKTEVLAFDKFEDARQALRDKLKGFAFSKNSMFNGKGQIKYLNKYILKMTDGEEDDENNECDEFDDFLSSKRLRAIESALYEVFSGNDTKLQIKRGTYTDYMIGVSYRAGAIRFFGDDDGPCMDTTLPFIQICSI